MKKLPIIGIALATLLASGSYAQELSQEQSDELVKIGQGFAQQATTFEGLIQGKLTELAQEVNREGRLDSEESAKLASDQTNVILKDLSGLYGEFIKTKVGFIVQAKNVLTVEQKQHLLSQLELQQSVPYEALEFMQPDIFDLPLDLNLEQHKKLVALEGDLLIAEVKLERDVELTLLDLEEVLLSGEISSDKVDPLVMKLAELAGRAIDNRVDYFIKAKDVLTLDQKRLLAYLLGLG